MEKEISISAFTTARHWPLFSALCLHCIPYCAMLVMFILVSSEFFVYQQMHFISFLENIKIYIKICIKTAPTYFGLRPSSGSLHMSLAKVTFIKLVKVRRYGLCGCVAACYIKWCVCCAHTPPWTCYNMLPHNRIVHNDVLLPI